jgi:hypothetical protein
MKHLISSRALSAVILREKNNKGADFTIKSTKTGKDFTFKISRMEFKGNWYTHVKVETQYLKFKRLGTYLNGKIIHQKQVVDSPSANAIAWVFRQVEQGKIALLDEQIELMHIGNCLCCGKILTDAESIETGLGPICGGRK